MRGGYAEGSRVAVDAVAFERSATTLRCSEGGHGRCYRCKVVIEGKVVMAVDESSRVLKLEAKDMN
jgi:hypothetical protein